MKLIKILIAFIFHSPSAYPNYIDNFLVDCKFFFSIFMVPSLVAKYHIDRMIGRRAKTILWFSI